MQESGSSGWQRKEVALRISSVGSNPSTLSDYGTSAHLSVACAALMLHGACCSINQLSGWQVMPDRACHLLHAPACAVDVQRMLLAEEQQAHGQRSSSGAGAPASDAHGALLQLRDAALHQGALIQHAECVLAPALAAMQQLCAQADLQAQQLADDNARLEKVRRGRAACTCLLLEAPSRTLHAVVCCHCCSCWRRSSGLLAVLLMRRRSSLWTRRRRLSSTAWSCWAAEARVAETSDALAV